MQPDRNRFLADIKVAEAADQPQPVQLPRPLLEAADEQHLAVEFQQLLPARLEPFRLGRTLTIGSCGGGD
jgi:hypothetical protein